MYYLCSCCNTTINNCSRSTNIIIANPNLTCEYELVTQCKLTYYVLFLTITPTKLELNLKYLICTIL